MTTRRWLAALRCVAYRGSGTSENCALIFGMYISGFNDRGGWHSFGASSTVVQSSVSSGQAATTTSGPHVHPIFSRLGVSEKTTTREKLYTMLFSRSHTAARAEALRDSEGNGLSGVPCGKDWWKLIVADVTAFLISKQNMEICSLLSLWAFYCLSFNFQLRHDFWKIINLTYLKSISYSIHFSLKFYFLIYVYICNL